LGIGTHNIKDGVPTKLPTPVVISSPQKVKKKLALVGAESKMETANTYLGPDFRQHHKGLK